MESFWKESGRKGGNVVTIWFFGSEIEVERTFEEIEKVEL